MTADPEQQESGQRCGSQARDGSGTPEQPLLLTTFLPQP